MEEPRFSVRRPVDIADDVVDLISAVVRADDDIRRICPDRLDPSRSERVNQDCGQDSAPVRYPRVFDPADIVDTRAVDFVIEVGEFRPDVLLYLLTWLQISVNDEICLIGLREDDFRKQEQHPTSGLILVLCVVILLKRIE